MTDLESFRAWAAGNLAGLTYVGPDPHHGLGLERIVPGYRAASSRAPILQALALLGVSVLDVDRADIADAAAMLALPEVAAFIESGGPRVPVLVFKSSDKVESCAPHKGGGGGSKKA